MPPNSRLAAALEELRVLQARGTRVFASATLKRSTREILVKHGFLQEVMRGWLISSGSSARTGDTTPWFASYWEFCRSYCDNRFGEAWHVSAELSLLLHAENTAVPRQLVIPSPKAHNDRIELPHHTSFFLLQHAMPPTPELELRNGIRVFARDAALSKVAPSFFRDHPVDARVVLETIRDPSALLARLLESRQSVVGGRLVGALRHIGSTAVANEILAALKAADIDARVSNPFEADGDTVSAPRAPQPLPPIVARLRELWKHGRDAVLAHAPDRRKPRMKRAAYLAAVEDVYALDAYHSLSIEGYQVTPQLVERVATGAWSPETDRGDRQSIDALAARGYWLAFQKVRDVAANALQSEDITGIRGAYRDWYRELFAPHVAAGILDAKLLAGHRNGPVYLRGSRHVPPRAEIVGDAMTAVFDLIENEPHAFVRAVLGHWLVGYVHPLPDGNGRIARFVMNALFAGGGYPWTVIRVESRSDYLSALEKASVDNDLAPFAAFIATQLSEPAKPSRKRAAKPRSKRR
jgi:hypothetical protein